MRRWNRAVKNDLFPALSAATCHAIFAKDEAERRESVIQRSAAHVAIVRRAESHQHLVLAAAKRQRGGRQVRNIIHVFAQDVDACRGAQNTYAAITIEL